MSIMIPCPRVEISHGSALVGWWTNCMDVGHNFNIFSAPTEIEHMVSEKAKE